MQSILKLTMSLALLWLVTTTMRGQNYEKEWKKIDSLESKGLPESALKETESLYGKLKTNVGGNTKLIPQLLKALIYWNKYQSQLEEDGLVKSIYRLQTEMEQASVPSKAILQTMLAEAYDQYLLNHLYKFQDRTAVESYKLEDIRTWDVSKITQKTFDLYWASVQHGETKKIAISDLTGLLTEPNVHAKGLRGNLYDFLLHRALDYFSGDRAYLTQPSYRFYVEQNEAFGDAKAFSEYVFKTRDSMSMSWQTLRLLQEATRYHQGDSDPSALIDVELRRLQYVYSKALQLDKDERYMSALQALDTKYTNHPSVAEVGYYIASYYQNKSGYSTLEDASRWYLKKAVELCDKYSAKFPNSYGAINCKALKTSILSKSVSLETERVYPLGTPMLCKVQYKNLQKLHLKLIRLSETDQKKLEGKYGEQLVTYLNSLPVVQTWTTSLKDEGDYQQHSVEIGIQGQSQSGVYAVLASANDRFSYTSNGLVVSYFNISNLSYLSKQVDGLYEHYVVNRQSGQPISGVKAEFYVQRYNSLLRRYEWRKVGEGLTDDNGYVKTPMSVPAANNGYSSSTVKFSKGEDVLDMNNTFYNYKYEKERPRDYNQTYFFTDRAIYRPGQTVYFKGLVVQNPGTKTPKIVANEKRTVEFLDVNYQQIAQVELTTNEYGSFQGSFTAPSSGLTGAMQIKDNSTGTAHYVRVEEYKRPKFEVNFNPVEGSYKIGDKVTTKGVAKAFAGNVIDDAKVQYRVVRTVEFPYWGWWYWGGWRNPYQRQEQEIVSGEGKTNEKGEYEVIFEAIADKSIPSKTKPLFNYTVYVDVTDNTGETHSSQTQVRVGYVALDADIEVPSSVMNDKATKWNIKTLNLNGQPEGASGKVKVEQIVVPSTVFVNRYWEKPDYAQMSEGEFKQQFPQYAYGTEDQSGTWKTVKVVLDASFDTKTSKELAIDPKGWSQGYYKVTLNTQDKYGEQIEVVKFCTVVSATEAKVPTNTAFYLQQGNWSAQPGDKVTAQFGTYHPGGYVLMELVEEGKVSRREWINTQQSQCVSRSFEVTEGHRGGFYVHWSGVYGNRPYGQIGTVDVPWTNKELNIEFATFRDKLAPGQQEEWQVKISGSKKDKVLAEVLAGMYDASLDQFAPNNWGLSIFPSNYNLMPNTGYDNFSQTGSSSLSDYYWNESGAWVSKTYAALNWFGFSFYDYGYYSYNRKYYEKGDAKMARDSGGEMNMNMPAPALEAPKKAISLDEKTISDASSTAGMPGTVDVNQQTKSKPTGEGEGDFGDVQIRTNLNETVFFFPQMQTDAEGNVVIKFKMNEALTKWKFMVFAHSQALQSAVATRSVVTQKDLMITPNAPRFFRQNDEIYFTAKVANMTKEKMSGQATLQLLDAISMQPIDAAFENSTAVQSFTTEGERSTGLSWRLKIPAGWTNAVTYRVIAKAGTFSDGEESSLPVLTNQMLVTETMPLPIRGSQTKTFQFGRMAEASKSSTLIQHKFTLEFTPNPAWYALQALPYMMEYPYECTEQIFSRYYSNSLASSVANAHPKIKKVFDTWRDYQPSALESNLTKNQDLKYALIEETPWVLNAQSEAQQKKNIGVLFDLNRMANELDKARDKMADRQLANGGFAWFPGGRDSWYITQYIVEGFGHLDALGVKEIKSDNKVDGMTRRAVQYTDVELARAYTELLEWIKRYTKSDKEFEAELAKDHLDYMAIHYMYARSFFLDQEVTNPTTKKAIEYYEGQAVKYWLNKSDYMQGMLALGFHRKKIHTTTTQDIVKSLKERALKNEEMGMYWKYPHGYYWYELPIETHALMIEVFDEVAGDMQAVDDLKTWLLKAKQTTHWQTTKATAAACYALLRRGDNWLLEDKDPVIRLGSQTLDLTKVQKEAGSGYFKTEWKGTDIKPEMATVVVENPNKNVAWGAIYWQYFENLDKITFFKETPLKINKKLFKVINTDKGQVLKPIENETLTPGDLLKVRIEIMVDRDMEYVHMKDMRAAGLEPVNVLSQYKYQGGLGYYESTKDMATHFFFDYLSKGTYVFEYPLRVNHKGDFSNGITTLQCMYAPEFTSHSEGVRVKIK